MANAWAGEVELTINGERRVLKLTLGALAELEDALEATSILDLVARFEGGAISSREVLALIVAGLRGGGWRGQAEDLIAAEIEGGPLAAAQAAGRLLALAFRPPAGTDG